MLSNKKCNMSDDCVWAFSSWKHHNINTKDKTRLIARSLENVFEQLQTFCKIFVTFLTGKMIITFFGFLISVIFNKFKWGLWEEGGAGATFKLAFN